MKVGFASEQGQLGKLALTRLDSVLLGDHIFNPTQLGLHPLRYYILDSTGLTFSTMADEAITNPLYSMTADDAMDTSNDSIELRTRPSPAPPSELPLTSIGMSQKFSPQSEVCNPDWIRRACLNPHTVPSISRRTPWTFPATLI